MKITLTDMPPPFQEKGRGLSLAIRNLKPGQALKVEGRDAWNVCSRVSHIRKEEGMNNRRFATRTVGGVTWVYCFEAKQ